MALSFEEWEKQKYGNSTTPSPNQPPLKGESFEEWEKRKYGQVTPTSQPLTQLPSTQTGGLFTRQDPRLLLETLKGFFPGVQEGLEDIEKYPQEYAGKVLGIPVSKQPWKTQPRVNLKAITNFVKNFPAFLAGAVVNPALTVSEIAGGPKQFGPWSSLLEQRRQLKGAGAGEAVAAGLPIAGEALALLGGKGVGKTLFKKPMPQATKGVGGITPPPPPSRMEPLEGILPKTPKEYQVKGGLGSIASRKLPFAALDDRVSQFGEGGQNVVKLVHRMEAAAPIHNARYNAELSVITQGLKPEQMVEFRNVVEGKQVVSTPEIANRAKIFRQFDDNIYQDLTQRGIKFPRLTDHWPRIWNKEGKKKLGLPDNYFDMMLKISEAKDQGITDATHIYENFIKPLGVGKKTFSEFERKLTPEAIQRIFGDVPDQYRASPLEELHSYTKQVARRVAASDEWGPKWEKMNAEIARTFLTERKGGLLAQELRDRAYGQPTTDAGLRALESGLNRKIMATYLNPVIGYIQNPTQGFFNSLLKFGLRPALAGAKALWPKTPKDVKGLGFLELANPHGKTWESWVVQNLHGFRTEKFGYKWAGLSAKNFIETNWKALLKNPKDTKAQTALDSLNIPWKKALKEGRLSPMEKAMGMNEGIRKVMFPPFLTSAPEHLGLENIFRRYMWQQGKLVSEAPFAKYRGAIGKAGILPLYLALSSLAGEPVGDIYAGLSGKERPKGLPRLLENISYGPGFFPAELFRGAGIPGQLTTTIAGAPWGIAEREIRNLSQVVTGKKTKTKRNALMRFLLGIPGVPMGGLLGRTLFSTNQK